MNLLELESLTKRFDGLIANENVNFKLSKGEIQSIIGPNGAGKTTLISMISGHLAPSEGRILFEQQDITRLSVEQRGRLGIIRKFQTPSVFLGLNVYDNIELASIAGGVRRKQLSKEVSAVFDLIGLGDQRFQLASTLSHGHRQWLEIGLLLA
ncbi:MAG: ATP-binding cassette domain-containing protein, partial [Rhodospirillaceae bacterium]|nr:ATP-binding cassette domain-containing protein [Rhodospirillaceae bacterium]